MSCDFAHLDGAYVLGALAASERADYERHLDDCPECARAVREVAGLPGLMARVPLEVLEAPDEHEPAPSTLLPAVVSEMQQARHRRTTVVAVAVAAVLVLVLGAAGIVLGVAGDGDDAPGAAAPTSSDVVPSERMEGLVGPAVTGWVALVDRDWGTRIELTCTYGDGSSDRWRSYTVVVRSVDGEVERLGSWRAEPGREAHVVLATSVPRDDIAAVLVQTPEGESVLRLTQ